MVHVYLSKEQCDQMLKDGEITHKAVASEHIPVDSISEQLTRAIIEDGRIKIGEIPITVLDVTATGVYQREGEARQTDVSIRLRPNGPFVPSTNDEIQQAIRHEEAVDERAQQIVAQRALQLRRDEFDRAMLDGLRNVEIANDGDRTTVPGDPPLVKAEPLGKIKKW